MSGFYLMHRGWQENHIFGNEEYSSRDAWVWLIEQAAWKPTRVRVKGQTINLERGELCFSQRFLAEKWRWSKSRVDRFLKRLDGENMISIRSKIGATAGQGSGQGNSVITICNYSDYQDKEEGQRGNNEPQNGPTPGQHRAKEEQVNKGTSNKVEDSATHSCPSPMLDDAVSLWNRAAASGGWPAIRSLSAPRRKALSLRIKEHGVDGWKAALVKAHASSFIASGNFFTFDWITKPANFVKLMDGNYDNRDKGTAAGHYGSDGPDRRDGVARALDRRIAAAEAAERSSVGEGDGDCGSAVARLAFMR